MFVKQNKTKSQDSFFIIFPTVLFKHHQKYPVLNEPFKIQASGHISLVRCKTRNKN